MNRNILKKYAPEARRDFIRAVTDRASYYGLTKKKTEPVTVEGDVAIISGRPFPKKVAEQRKRLEEKVNRLGFEQVMEAVAYTWFNRLVAIRYMELHGYLDHGYRVLSHPEGDVTPEVVEHAEHLDLPRLDRQKVISLKLEGTKESELYRMLLIAQCNALHKAMPFLFEHIGDETELLLPDNLLHSDSLIRTLVKEIPEEDWQEVEIIGWLYQFYISEKKDQVIGKVVKSEDIPAATQLFTPNWIVKYLVQNSLGRQWMATYPNSPLKAQMEYYIEPAEQTPEVQEQLKAITPKSLNPEELTLLDPACGSGHILVEAYDLLKAIYQERGYRVKEIPRLILEKNLFGLEIDDRAAQLAAFALMMKARADSHRIFDDPVQLHVLAIQESKGLDAREITEALNQPIFKGEAPPPESLFEEIDDDKAPLFSRKNLSEPGHISLSDVAQLIDLFEHGKTFGSLIQVPEKLAERLPAIDQRIKEVLAHGGMFEQATTRSLKVLTHQSSVLAGTFSAIVANPPYMGSKYCNPRLKSFVSSCYPDGKADLCTALMEQGFARLAKNGLLGFITMQSWMFLSSFEKFRLSLLHRGSILCMAHLGSYAFPQIGGQVVQATAFVANRHNISAFRGSYRRLLEGDSDEKAARIHSVTNYTPSNEDFDKIPGSPVAYWASKKFFDAFANGTTLGSKIPVRKGMDTANNDMFLRYWYEVDFRSLGFGYSDSEVAMASGRKWFPYKKGGSFRRWYGNNEFVVNWHRDGAEVREFGRGTIRSKEFFFRASLTWSATSDAPFAVRYCESGFISDAKGSACYPQEQDRFWLLAYLNTPVTDHVLKSLNPTLEFQAGNVSDIPLLPSLCAESPVCKEASTYAAKAVEEARQDWGNLETSWDFQELPSFCQRSGTVENWQAVLSSEALGRIEKVKEYEEEINRLFISAFGLDELSPEVPEDQITLYRPKREEDIKHLISYAIGCVMGRYTLDQPGLIYAHSGGEGFDANQYQTFPADADGSIPITDFEWFEDDAANRLEDFIGTAWPKKHLEENLKFIADSLGPNKGERPRETIRRYLSTGFYKHHLQLYKKRPIYWLFSSGKQRAFQCLVYLHRYNEGTLSRMRTEYVIPLSGQMASRIDQLEGDIATASSTSHRKKLEKERQTLIKQREELQAFAEQLRHYADQRIKLDLDDGVKVNYGKFGNLLAEVKAVTGKKPGE